MKFEQNQDSIQVLAAVPSAPQANASGWDPFQVWLTRVREPQLQAANAMNSRNRELAPELKKAS
jgi:hypothetical protein